MYLCIDAWTTGSTMKESLDAFCWFTVGGSRGPANTKWMKWWLDDEMLFRPQYETRWRLGKVHRWFSNPFCLLIPEGKNKTISADIRMIDFGAAAIFRSHPVSSFSITRTCTAEVMCWISTTAISFWGKEDKNLFEFWWSGRLLGSNVFGIAPKKHNTLCHSWDAKCAHMPRSLKPASWVTLQSSDLLRWRTNNLDFSTGSTVLQLNQSCHKCGCFITVTDKEPE